MGHLNGSGEESPQSVIQGSRAEPGAITAQVGGAAGCDAVCMCVCPLFCRLSASAPLDSPH